MFFLLLFFPTIVSGIIITEIQVAGEESVDESYIKIYNPSPEIRNLSGYNLRKKTSTGTDSSVRVFPPETTIKGEEYLIWSSSRESNFPEKIGADITSTQYLSPDNSVALFNDEGELLDAVAWGNSNNPYVMGISLDNPSEGQIITRKKEDGSYQQTNNNSLDYYLDPPQLSPLQVEKTYTKKQEEKEQNYFLISFSLSLILATIILFIKRNGRTQSL